MGANPSARRCSLAGKSFSGGFPLKLLRFSKGGRGQFGLLEDESVYEVTASPFTDPPERGPFVGHINELRLLAPCEPTKIICAAKNYPWGENPSKSPKPRSEERRVGHA